MLRKALGLGALVAAVTALTNPASATIISSTTGTFTGDEATFALQFTLTGSGPVIARTLGYAGGTQVDGNVVAAGGFNSDLALFSGTGSSATLLASDDDSTGNPLPGPSSSCGAGAVKTDPTTGLVGDSCISLLLGAGTYTLVLTEYDNDAIGPTLGAGFFESIFNPGDPTFTSINGCSNGQFCDAGGNNRTDAFALDVTVPEPATLPILATGLLALGLMRHRWNA